MRLTTRHPLILPWLALGLLLGLAGCAGFDEEPQAERKGHHQRMEEELDLTPAQQQAFDTARVKMRDSMRGGMALQETLRPLVEAEKFDEKAVRQRIRQHYAEQEARQLDATRSMHEFYVSLTPAQRQQFSAMKDDMHENMKEHMREKHKARKRKAARE